ncbi:LysR family transcriptional regulator [Enterobacter sp. RHBSTW-00994]|uniref:LysR family transcriptional regulator n=1 Tax=Enterobacter sp. RHBSTW-00994 TaxID=2742676 RepID=UPI0015E9BD81|nr:LysR family transcriptional regulator [Enterobacter sp. RHBSTW-00994]QLR43331.1 LysR family transcriptional regulator [Enterobacter sp. RHBSTW-00994]
MSLNPGDLLLFVRVVEEGTFTHAAEKMGLPKSTLSRRISHLENALGELLLRRSTRKLSITDFGHEFYLQAKRVAQELDIASAMGDQRQLHPTGSLRVSIPGDFTGDMLGHFLTEFVARYPAIRLDIDVSQRRVDLLGENVDVAIRLGALIEDSTLIARRIATFQPGLFASPAWLAINGEPQTPAALLNHPVLALYMHTSSSPPWELTHNNERWQGSPPLRITANAPGILRSMAVAGAGITCLARHFVRQQVGEEKLKPLLEDWKMAGIPVWAVFPDRRLLPARTRIFIDELEHHLRHI